MKKLFFLLAPAVFLLSCSHPVKNEKANEVIAIHTGKDSCCMTRDGVFIHITSGYENPHRALMPLKMATIMADDKDVIVYMDIQAVKLVLKDSKDMKFAEFPPLKELLQQLIAKKVIIMACPTCLKIAGKTPDDLMPGVTVAQKDKFFNFTKGRILALDY
jgi:predicted peroxiredoxin